MMMRSSDTFQAMKVASSKARAQAESTLAKGVNVSQKARERAQRTLVNLNMKDAARAQAERAMAQLRVSDATRSKAERTLTRAILQAESLDNRRCRIIVTGLRNTLMWADMISDMVVVASLRGTPYFDFGLFLLFMPFVVLAVLLFRPAYRLQSRLGTYGIPPMPLYIFAPIWAVVAVPLVVSADLILFTWYMCIDTYATAHIAFYARLRHVSETLFESLPQSFFQLAISLSAGKLEFMTVVSVLISLVNMIVNGVELTVEAQERGVSLPRHVIDVAGAGFGVLPFISAIRARRLEDVSYADTPLISRDVEVILAAVADGARKADEVAAKRAELGAKQGPATGGGGGPWSSKLKGGSGGGGSGGGGSGGTGGGQLISSMLSRHSGDAHHDTATASKAKTSLESQYSNDVAWGGRGAAAAAQRYEQQQQHTLEPIVEKSAWSPGSGIESLDLANVGLLAPACSHGFDALLDAVASRKLGNLKHLALDGNGLGRDEGLKVGQALASAIKRGIARTTDVPDATAFDAANAFNRAKPALPTSVVVDGRLIDIKAVVSRTKVDFRELDLLHKRDGSAGPQGDEEEGGGGGGGSNAGGSSDSALQPVTVLPAFALRLLTARGNGIVPAELVKSKFPVYDSIVAALQKAGLLEKIYRVCESGTVAARRWGCLPQSSDASSAGRAGALESFDSELDEEAQRRLAQRLKWKKGGNAVLMARAFAAPKRRFGAHRPVSVKNVPVNVLDADDVEMAVTGGGSGGGSKRRNSLDTEKTPEEIASLAAWGAAEQAMVLSLLPLNRWVVKLALGGGDFTASGGDSGGGGTGGAGAGGGGVKDLCAALRCLPALDFLDLRGSRLDKAAKRLLAAALDTRRGASCSRSGSRERSTTLVLETKSGSAEQSTESLPLTPVPDNHDSSDDDKDDKDGGSSNRSSATASLALSVAGASPSGHRGSSRSSSSKTPRSIKTKSADKVTAVASPSGASTPSSSSAAVVGAAPMVVAPPERLESGVRYLACDEWVLLPGTLSLAAEGRSLGDDDVALLAVALRRNDELQELHLKRNKIYERGESAIAACLTDFNRTLKNVDLRGNVRPAAGAALIAAALSPNCELEVLNGIPLKGLSSSSLSNSTPPKGRAGAGDSGGNDGSSSGTGGSGGSKRVGGGGPLEDMNLSKQWLGPEGWDVLIAVLAANRKTVKRLNASHTPTFFSSHQERALRAAAARQESFAQMKAGSPRKRGSSSSAAAAAASRGASISNGSPGNNGSGASGSGVAAVAALGAAQTPRAEPRKTFEANDVKHGASLAQMVCRKKSALEHVCLDFCGGLDGDVFLRALAASLAGNNASKLSSLELRGTGVTAGGKQALADALLESAAPPLAYFACDQWEIGLATVHLRCSHHSRGALQANKTPRPQRRPTTPALPSAAATAAAGAGAGQDQSGEEGGTPQTSPTKASIPPAAPPPPPWSYDLRGADIALLAAVLARNTQVHTLEVEAGLLDMARISDVAALLAPRGSSQWQCSLQRLAVVVNPAPPSGGDAGKQAFGSVGSYYAACAVEPGRVAPSSADSGQFAESPPHALEGLFQGLAKNQSLTHLHLTLRPADAGDAFCTALAKLEPYAEVLNAKSSSSNNNNNNNLSSNGQNSGSNKSKYPMGSSLDGGSNNNGVVSAAAAAALKMAIVAAPAWVEAFSFALANGGGASLAELALRGDASVLRSLCSEAGRLLVPLQEHAPALERFELQLLGPPGLNGPQHEGGALCMQESGEDDYDGGPGTAYLAAGARAAATGALATRAAAMAAPPGELLGGGAPAPPPPAPQLPPPSPTTQVGPAVMAARRAWLEAETRVLQSTAALVRQSGPSLAHVRVDLLAPGFGYLADGALCADQPFGFGGPLLRGGLARRPIGSLAATADADDSGGGESGHFADNWRDDGDGDGPYHGPMQYAIPFEQACTDLARAAAPPATQVAIGSGLSGSMDDPGSSSSGSTGAIVASGNSGSGTSKRTSAVSLVVNGDSLPVLMDDKAASARMTRMAAAAWVPTPMDLADPEQGNNKKGSSGSSSGKGGGGGAKGRKGSPSKKKGAREASGGSGSNGGEGSEPPKPAMRSLRKQMAAATGLHGFMSTSSSQKKKNNPATPTAPAAIATSAAASATSEVPTAKHSQEPVTPPPPPEEPTPPPFTPEPPSTTNVVRVKDTPTANAPVSVGDGVASSSEHSELSATRKTPRSREKRASRSKTPQSSSKTAASPGSGKDKGGAPNRRKSKSPEIESAPDRASTRFEELQVEKSASGGPTSTL